VQVLGPLVVVTIGLFALYLIMPNTKVRVMSALLGSVLGGVLWYVFLVLHVQFQMGVARFNALYSSFAAFPIFLVWAYFSWLSVMVGASVAAAHQNGEARAGRIRWSRLETANKEALALSLMTELTRSFVHGTPESVRIEGLSNHLGVPASLLQELVACLAAADLVAVADEQKDPRLVLTRAPERIRVSDILTALRGRIDEATQDNLAATPNAIETLTKLAQDLESSRHNRTLRELAAS
jgi:membrane protein